VKRSLALLKWKLPVIWVAGSEPAVTAAEAVPQAAAAQPVTVVHYHLHLEAGADAAEAIRQAGLSVPRHGAELPEGT